MWWMALLDKAKANGEGEDAERDYGASASPAAPIQAAPVGTTADTSINGEVEAATPAPTQPQPTTADSDVNGAAPEQDDGGNGGAKAKAAFQQIGAMMKQGGQNQKKRQTWGAY